MSLEKSASHMETKTEEAKFSLRLYVDGQTPETKQIVDRIKGICEHYVRGRYAVEIVDLEQDPERANSDSVMVTPLLVKFTPPPVQRVVGNFSEPGKIAQVLGLEKK